MSRDDDPGPMLARLGGPIRAATLLIAVFVIGFGAWAAHAPLTTAAVAPGRVGVEIRRQVVQHLDGGIIDAILVHEGDEVEAGQLLIRLDDTMARSTFDLLEGQFIDMLAEQARLEAERAELESLDMTPELAAVVNADRVARAMRVQRDLFESRRRTLRNSIDILEQRILEIEEQVRGFAVQQASLEQRRTIISKEQEAVERLVRQGLEREPRLLGIQRAAAEIEGAIGEIRSRAAQAEMRIGETRLEILDLSSRMANQVTADLRDLAGRLASMAPRLRAAEATLGRIEIRAPASGTVVGLRHHTVGGVIGPGERIMDIVPGDLGLLVEAWISPADIDVVRPGLPAEVRLIAFAARTTPTVPGEVVHVSADRLSNQTGEQQFYAAHVLLTPTEGGMFPNVEELYPGMPVEVMVVTGERTALGYLIRPLTDMFARAFRES